MHEEKKPQTCQICGRVFKYKLAFVKHVQTHSEFVKTERIEGEEERVDSSFEFNIPIKVEMQEVVS